MQIRTFLVENTKYLQFIYFFRSIKLILRTLGEYKKNLNKKKEEEEEEERYLPFKWKLLFLL
jgi:hypothetical protein